MLTSSILVAEPTEFLRDAIARALRLYEFAVIPTCETNLIWEVQKRRPEMAIIGPSLADIGHIREAALQIVQSPIWIPLLLLVSNSSEELAIAALKAGISEYLKFPCSPSELAEAVRQCLRRVGRHQCRGVQQHRRDLHDDERHGNVFGDRQSGRQCELLGGAAGHTHRKRRPDRADDHVHHHPSGESRLQQPALRWRQRAAPVGTP